MKHVFKKKKKRMYSKKIWLTCAHSPFRSLVCSSLNPSLSESLWGAPTKSSKGTRTDNDLGAVWFLIFDCSLFCYCISTMHKENMYLKTASEQCPNCEVLQVLFFIFYLTEYSFNTWWSKGGSAHPLTIVLAEGGQRFDFYQIEENNKTSTPEIWANRLLLKY